MLLKRPEPCGRSAVEVGMASKELMSSAVGCRSVRILLYIYTYIYKYLYKYIYIYINIYI